ncbi:MAG: T9SS type A sorting domain-containing protein [Saprospiraceae bacterium]|uniref:T9SS type A sorting domain-containing protein n=1 Tax=Candidatus Defluviibacterium haderslevense TaxID=2981993 RepID=A0A9D7SAK8_9BACT|nr:T9SS type A sorting domain-containing protein [Candidatus Defluviibacterium haderslevense]
MRALKQLPARILRLFSIIGLFFICINSISANADCKGISIELVIGKCSDAFWARYCSSHVPINPIIKDACPDQLNWYYSYQIDIDNDQLIDVTMDPYSRQDSIDKKKYTSVNKYRNFQDNGYPFNASADYPIGTHRISYTIKDDCGFTTTSEIIFEVKDCSPPKTSSFDFYFLFYLDVNGEYLLRSTDIKDEYYDVCDGNNINIYFNGNPLQDTFVIKCNDLEFGNGCQYAEFDQYKYLTIEDQSFNNAYDRIQIRIVDTFYHCNLDSTCKYIHIRHLSNKPLDNVIIKGADLSSSLNFRSTPCESRVTLPYIDSWDRSFSYLCIYKDSNSLNGIDVCDASIIRKNFYSGINLDSSILRFVGDVNNNNSASISDALNICRKISGVSPINNISDFPWYFYSTDSERDKYIFDKWSTSPNLLKNKIGNNIIVYGFKKGDMNMDALSYCGETKTLPTDCLNLNYHAIYNQELNKYSILVYSSNFNEIEGFQGSLLVDTMLNKLMSVKYNQEKFFGSANADQLEDGKYTFALLPREMAQVSLSPSDTLFEFEMELKPNVNINDIKLFLIADANPIAYDIHDNPLNICLERLSVDTKINNSDENIRIFPNPGKDIIYIDYQNYFNEMYVDIYDLIGHKLTSQIVMNHEINTKGLSRGIYTIVARNNEFTKAIKWIKF